MLYVKDVIGFTAGWVQSEDCHIIVSEDGVDKECRVYDMLGSKCIGVGSDMTQNGLIATAIKHSAKELRVYDHVEQVNHEYSTSYSGLSSLNEDWCVIGDGVTRQYVRGTNNTISICTARDIVSVHGHKGSVATWYNRWGSLKGVCTLWKLLKILCRESGINLLTYRMIHIYNNTCGGVSTIKFKDDKVFFTKMFIDICGDKS